MTLRLLIVNLEPCPQEARLDQFRLIMNWNREELAQWALAHAQREDDALALEAYRRQARLSSGFRARVDRATAAGQGWGAICAFMLLIGLHRCAIGVRRNLIVA